MTPQSTDEAGCRDGCCSSAPPSAEINVRCQDSTITEKSEDKAGYDGGCCSAATSPVKTDAHCQDQIITAQTPERKDDSSCHDGCCSSSATPSAKADACCNDPVVAEKISQSADDSSCCDCCCSSSAVPSVKANACCEGQTTAEQNSCCSAEPKEQKLVTSSSTVRLPMTPQPNDESSCYDGCCSSPAQLAMEENIQVKNESDCHAGCCSSSVTPSVNIDTCCEGQNAAGKDACCNVRAKKRNAKNSLSKEGCCNEECLDELVFRSYQDSESNNQSANYDDPTAYNSRKESIRQRYTPSLEALGCLCRALMALNLESCCVSTARRSGSPRLRKRQTGSAAKRRSSHPTQSSTSPRASQPSCASFQNEKGSIMRSSSFGKQARYSRGCCLTEQKNKKTIHRAGAKQSAKQTVLKTENPHSSKSRDDVDIERGSKMEHAALTVRGMTCTGCETKLSRSLAGIPSITNIRTSLVLSRAEFDFNSKAVSFEELKSRLEAQTGFTCERIADREDNTEEIEVLYDDPEGLLSRRLLPGTRGVERADKGVVRIQYDRTIVGARDLISKGFSVPLKLAPIRPPASIAAGRQHLRKMGASLILSIVLTIPVLILAWAPLPKHDRTYGAISLALATVIQVIVAGPFYSSALKSLIFSRVIEMDLLIVLSTSAAYIFSVVAFAFLLSGRPLETGEFFETNTLLVTLIMVGRFIGGMSRQKAVESVSVRSLQPQTALIVSPNGQESIEVDSRLLHLGDHFKVPPDTRVVTDGTVISGTSEVDESMVTGETRLIEKASGSSVVAGSVNRSGLLLVRVTHLPGSNTISQIAEMVDEAKLSKPKIQDIADLVASYFVPVVALITIITFSIWIGIGTTVRNQTGSEAAVRAITYAIATLIVSCPCAIGLAVPMVIVIASSVAAEHGVVVKSAQVLEVARKASHVVFDKTGTLTEGKLSIVRELYPAGSKDSTVDLVYSLVKNVKHPVSAATAEHLERECASLLPVDSVQSMPGKGVEGRIGNSIIRVGNCRWLNVEGVPEVLSLLSEGLTVFCVQVDGELRAVYGLTDILRTEALSVISRLATSGITVSIVSGDEQMAVESVASALNVPLSNVKARCSPAEKRNYIQKLSQNGKNVTIFCGDGTNDSVALAQATVGLHMSGGTDVACSAADAVLTRSSLEGILVLMDISRATFRRFVFNFSWAFVYNLFAILLAAGAFVDWSIPPAYAGLGEIVSVLPVIVIAMQLKWKKFCRE